MRKRKPLRIPVTRGLKDIYAMDMHLAYESACRNRFSVISFSRLAAALSVVRAALEHHKTTIPEAIPTLDAALEILMAVREKGDATDVWEISEIQRPVVLEGIDMAEQTIGTLDVALLEQTAELLLRDICNRATVH
jgi:hypothetical protein